MLRNLPRSAKILLSQPLRNSSAAKAPRKPPAETDSFIMNMFRKRLCLKELHPFPKVLSEERVDALAQMIDPVQKYIEAENDPLKNDETEKFDPKFVEGLRELGAFGLQVPEEYNGVALCNTEYARVVSVVGLTDLALGIFLGSHQSIGYKGILLYGTPEQKKKYLPDLAAGKKLAAYCLTEPGHGSDAKSIKTKAVLSSDKKHYILNGTKVWISNGGWADVFTVFAQVPVTDETGQTKDKMTGFIVERAHGVKHSEPEDKMGIRASNTVTLYLEDVKVPVENVLGNVGEGFKVAVNILNQGRFGMASALSGTMRTAIRMSTDHATQRHQFDRKIKDFESVKEKLAMMAMRQYATEAMAFMISGIMDLGAKDFQLEAAASKIYSSESAWFCVDEAIQIHGGMGFIRQTNLERVLRDLRVFRIFEGANDVLRLFVSLTAIQHAGNHLVASSKSGAGMLALVTGNLMTNLGMHPSGGQFAAALSPSLSEAGKMTGACVDKIGASVMKLVLKHRKGIIEEQFKLTRLADAAINTYAAACALSRADQAVRKSSPTAEHEVKLAKLAAIHGFNVCDRALNEIDRQGDMFELMRSVSKEVTDNLGVIPKAPIGV